jgi:acetyl-CoA/propionyl-CoA carboxylase biotin carboxyl carrier protein
MFGRVLIANRGEISVRIARTCRELGIESVAVYSDVDAGALHTRAADRAIHLPGVEPEATYLNAPRLIAAAHDAGAEAVHPGYGFLAESAGFARSVIDAGLAWIGPPPDAILALGDKISARRLAIEAGVPVIPGLLDPVGDPSLIEEFAAEHGYPVAIKAAGGGGGRGLKVARSPGEVRGAFDAARREAVSYFGSSEVFAELYLDSPKHLEVQLLAPNPDEALWMGVRDCSLQRRHQKLIEETPPPRHRERAHEMGSAAVALSKAACYVNAGTVEMLVDDRGDFHFLEVNSRLQVEHTVTEEVLGIDLVACQLSIAAGEGLDFTQADLNERGHAIECRINAEDPARGFIPAPGRLDRYVEPGGPGVRVDSGYAAGLTIPGAYDSLIAKVVVRGTDRDQARARMQRALHEFEIDGVATTIPAHHVVLDSEEFVSGNYTTTTMDSGLLDTISSPPEVDAPGVLLVGGRPVKLWHPAMAASANAAVSRSDSPADVTAPLQGTVLEVLAEAGRQVEVGTPLFVIEAMKMETTVASRRSGRITEVSVTAGDSVTSGELLARVE